MSAKVCSAIGMQFLIFAALLFGAAGTVRWPAGWAFMALFFGAVLLITQMLARHDPALLDERMKPLIQKNQPLWDQIIMSIMGLLFASWLVLMGLDAVRFGWSVLPAWLPWIGGVGVALSLGVCYRVFQENAFLAPVVKIQTERGQAVISTGPYAVIRHPLYAGVLLFFPSTSLMLGSWWGLAATVMLAGGLVARTAMEDRELKRGLTGYSNYASHVRYRLVPFVW